MMLMSALTSSLSTTAALFWMLKGEWYLYQVQDSWQSFCLLVCTIGTAGTDKMPAVLLRCLSLLPLTVQAIAHSPMAAVIILLSRPVSVAANFLAMTVKQVRDGACFPSEHIFVYFSHYIFPSGLHNLSLSSGDDSGLTSGSLSYGEVAYSAYILPDAYSIDVNITLVLVMP
jgi:hypothetical protein